MSPTTHLVHATAAGTKVVVEPGIKSRRDFIVSYSIPNGSSHRVLHSELIVDLYRKRAANPGSAEVFVAHLVEMIARTSGAKAFPPELVQFDIENVDRLAQMGLPSETGYDLELFLVLFELVQIQEETNYPAGWLPRTLYEHIRDAGDDLERVAYLTEVGVPRREYPSRLAARDQLLQMLRRVVGG